MRRAALLFNPAAGRRRSRDVVRELLSVLQAHGWTAEPLPTKAPGSATGQVRERVAQGELDAVFAYGGDGTLREVAQGLLGTPTALGALPGGTTNVVCHSLGLPPDPITAADALADGRWREICVGRIDGHIFLMQVSAGIDAAVVASVAGESKARWGRGAVLVAGLARLWKHRFEPIEARWGGRTLPGGFVAVANLPHYAGPFELAGVRAEAPELELVVHRPVGRWAAVLFAIALLHGRHGDRADVVRARVREVTISAPEGTCLQIDGDVCAATLPATIRVADERLRILAPR